MNLALKARIVASGKKSYEVAGIMNWQPSKLSTVISGLVEPSWAEKKKLAEILECQVGDVFPSKNEVAS